MPASIIDTGAIDAMSDQQNRIQPTDDRPLPEESDSSSGGGNPYVYPMLVLRGVLLVLAAMATAWFILATQDPRWFGDPH